jgi:hypothetical protein
MGVSDMDAGICGHVLLDLSNFCQIAFPRWPANTKNEYADSIQGSEFMILGIHEAKFDRDECR